MRAHWADVKRHPSWVLDWLIDLPCRRREFWGRLLSEKGQGWLRWGIDVREGWEYDDNACAPYHSHDYQVAPPLRRLWIYLAQWPRVPRLMLVGVRWPEEDGPRYHFAWEEAQPCWPSDMREPDRKKELWRDPSWRKRRWAFNPTRATRRES